MIRTSSFVPDPYQHAVERIASLIPPKGILDEELTEKAERLYNPKFYNGEFVRRILAEMERLGVIVYHSKLIMLVPEKIRRNMRRVYLSLKS